MAASADIAVSATRPENRARDSSGRPIRSRAANQSHPALMIATVAFVVYERSAFRSESRRTVTAIADVVAWNSTAALSFDNRSDAADVLNALRAEPDLIAAGLIGRSRFSRRRSPRPRPV